MAAPRHRHRRHLPLSLAAITFLLLASDQSFFSTAEGRRLGEGMAAERLTSSRRRLSGPGSSPPSCRGKCGRCSPCTAVHITIQPGRSAPMEYYPEAWRCECRNKFFMP